ncbi:MAG: hypothetical protein JXA69_14620 [Phycisphaerae bacterium]|nr:hypothetical protein [Phycisphaerae bacterium]
MTKLVLLCALFMPAAAGANPADGFKIVVVDEQTGRGVPLVELKTVHGVRYYTDSNGIVAFHEPGLMDQRVFFEVASHGYEYPKDGFGYRGKALDVTPGGSATLKIKRINIAERLYRITGAGIYRDSVLTGQAVPIQNPVINGLVLGSDSVLTVVYQGKVYWFWGDTSRPGYPLGNFHASGATSRLPADGGLDSDAGVDLTYFVGENGFARGVAPISGEGAVWLGGLVTLDEPGGKQAMLAYYVRIRPPMTGFERGLMEYNDEKERFERLVTFDFDGPLFPNGHPLEITEDGVRYFYYAQPYPVVRIRADRKHLMDQASFEAFTCLKAGTGLDAKQIDRDAAGRVQYGWKRNTSSVGPQEQANLIKDGQLKPEEALFHLQDVDTGKAVLAHGASVYWNAWRSRWVMITVEIFGTSMLGEVWYAEADTPLGPWVYARKIMTHDTYSFYNPKEHPFFQKDGGRILYFEGTYTAGFSGNTHPTPRYDYNQIMYKLDLADPRLVLPVPVYRIGPDAGRFTTRTAGGAKAESAPIAFFALDRPRDGTVPVFETTTPDGRATLHVGTPPAGADPSARPVFHALPAEATDLPATAMPLYVFVHRNGRDRMYGTDGDAAPPDFTREDKPLCHVWRSVPWPPGA